MKARKLDLDNALSYVDAMDGVDISESEIESVKSIEGGGHDDTEKSIEEDYLKENGAGVTGSSKKKKEKKRDRGLLVICVRWNR